MSAFNFPNIAPMNMQPHIPYEPVVHEPFNPLFPLESNGEELQVSNLANTQAHVNSQDFSPISILNLIKSEFPIPSDGDFSIALDKFIPYLDSFIALYNVDTSNTIDTYLSNLQKIATHNEVHINIEHIRQVITELFNIDKESENYTILLKLLQANRYIIYCSQFINIIIESNKPEKLAGNAAAAKPVEPKITPDNLVTNINKTTGKKEYFNIFNVFVIDCILSEMDVFSKHPALYLLTASLELEKTNVVNTSKSCITTFFNHIKTGNLIKTYLFMHGISGVNTYVIPKNKIVVLMTPFNRVGIINKSIKQAVELMLSPNNIAAFIASPTCFIDKFISNLDSMQKDAGLNGTQIFYSGQTYFDIHLSIKADDLANGFGSYKLVDDKLQIDQIFTKETVPINTTLNEYLNGLNMDEPEIIVLYCCRSANEKINNGIIELTYRYNKLHNLIVDNIGLCYKPAGEIPNIYPSPFKIGNDYTKQYTKMYDIQIPAKHKLSASNNELQKSLFKNTALTPIRKKK